MPLQTVVPRLLGRLTPPLPLGGRIRWLFLLFALLNLLTSVPRQLSAHNGVPPQQLVTSIAALGVLAFWWTRGYRLGEFPAWAVPAEAVLFYFAVLGYGEWVGVVGLLFVAVSFRGLFGGWRLVLWFTAGMFAASTAAVLRLDPGALAAFLQQAAGVPPFAIFTSLVAVSTGRQERAALRERALSRVGTTLATAVDQETILSTMTSAAEQMLSDAPGRWAAASLPSASGQVIANISGSAPASLVAADALAGMPEAIAAAFADGVAVYRSGNGYSLTAGSTILLGLRSGRHTYGTLLAGSARPLPDEVRASLEALAGQSALALINAEYAADLRHQAFHDHLTGLANRALLREHMSHALARARRGSAVAVLLVDLDEFKAVNDAHGHATGDQLLVAVSQRLRDGIRGADTAARLGGDEFAVLLDGMDAPGDALLVAQRLLESLQLPTRVSGVALHPAASIGVAIWRGHLEIDAFLHDADSAMYTAKTAGKGCVAYLDGGGVARLMQPAIASPAHRAAADFDESQDLTAPAVSP